MRRPGGDERNYARVKRSGSAVRLSLQWVGLPFQNIGCAMRPSRSNMPGLAPRGMEMKHTGNALWTILACGGIRGTLPMSALPALGDKQNPTDKFKNLEFREIAPAT